KRMQIDSCTMKLEQLYRKALHQSKEQFVKYVSKLDALSPLKILKRGYSVTEDEKGNPVSSVKRFTPGDKVNVTLSDGTLHCDILTIENTKTRED
ncbi:MAG: hypothetical protein IJ367_02450, partial [Clostridia bacterium]|nr:hypothetical protein [Clostridia bacterium]